MTVADLFILYAPCPTSAQNSIWPLVKRIWPLVKQYLGTGQTESGHWLNSPWPLVKHYLATGQIISVRWSSITRPPLKQLTGQTASDQHTEQYQTGIAPHWTGGRAVFGRAGVLPDHQANDADHGHGDDHDYDDDCDVVSVCVCV